MSAETTLHLGSAGGQKPPGVPMPVPAVLGNGLPPENDCPILDINFDFAADKGGHPKKVTVHFDNPNDPSPNDLAKLLTPPISDHFELHDGKIRARYVPIRERVKNPQGRTDYGWNDEMKKRHLTSAYARGWKQFPYPRPAHNGVLHIVGGGPSLRDCIPELRRAWRRPRNFVAALNKTHDFLLNLPKHGLGQAIKPWAAALLDPCDWVKDYITPHQGVHYFIGDQCAPATFDVFERPELAKHRWIFRSIKVAGDFGIPP